ncbi:MAG TPA: lytic transglycosylase domain-containing protein [Longimicrobiales bacterium]|nr:lytic transglycosylase domain-containing protein [Longimicrobiales bacterium]
MWGTGRARELGVFLRRVVPSGHGRRVRQLGLGVVLVSTAAMLPTVRPQATVVAASAADEAQVEQEARSNAVFDALDEYFRDREVELAAGTYAQRFRIPTGLATIIYTAAREEEIRPEVAFGLVRAESSFRPRVVSQAGAVGLTQVLPSTGRWIMPGTTRGDLMDPEKNVRVGFRYLRYLYEKYDGDEGLALTAYNRGPGTVDRHLSQGRNPDNGYVEMVLRGHSRRHTNLMNVRFGSRRS